MLCLSTAFACRGADSTPARSGTSSVEQRCTPSTLQATLHTAAHLRLQVAAHTAAGVLSSVRGVGTPPPPQGAGCEAYARRGSMGSYEALDEEKATEFRTPPPYGGGYPSGYPRALGSRTCGSRESVYGQTPDGYRVRWEGARSPDRA